ncbi:recombinase family protein [Candidatus Nomurabacteria bacterium]|nr:recombinase family protein [Candidatus Nomurabacteria bacterium]
MNAINYTNHKRAVIYVRVSTKEQVDEGNSLSTQQKICSDYALKHEYEVAETFIEQGESAKTADRTELQRLLAYCADKKHGIKAVIIYKLDRLSRNTDDYSQLRLLLKRYGVEIKSTSEHFENNPVGRFMENTMANIAQFDNDIRSERCAGGMRDAMRDGRYVWMATIGYRNVKIGGRATIEQDEIMAPLILRAFELIASNIYPTEEVRRMMTKEGLLNKKGKPFSKGYFYAMLTNELFAGWIVKFGERHRGTFTPIISDELFNQVQRVLKHKGRKHSAYITDHPDFPLRKFVINQDGKKLTGSWSKGRYKKYPFYRFGGNNSNHNRDKFEEEFMKYVNKYGFDDTKIKRLKELVRENLVKATLDQRKETDRLKKYINELTEKQTGIIKKNLDGVIPDNVLKQQLAMIDKELLNANASLAVMPNTETNYEEAVEFLEEYLKNPSAVWKDAKIGVKTKLQWFQFPQGLTFQNNFFGTTEMCSFFKVKDLALEAKSSNVE